MSCEQLDDRHMAALAMIKSGERLPVYDDKLARLYGHLARLQLVRWDEGERPIAPASGLLGAGFVRILPDGQSTLDDYRALGADV